ncbi:hypothetical protein [Vreelandella sulfidaeris]
MTRHVLKITIMQRDASRLIFTTWKARQRTEAQTLFNNQVNKRNKRIKTKYTIGVLKMKDLVNIAKSVVAIINPKKEALQTNAKQLSEKLASVKIESKNETIKATKDNILLAANSRLANFEHKREKQEIDYKDLSVEVTHAKYNASLLELDTKAMQYVIKREINFSDAVNQSREYKKRIKMTLTAIAHKDASKLDKALASLQTALKTYDKDEITVDQVARIMQHSTTTQANYFKKFGAELGMVSASRSNQVPMTLNKESAIYKDFIAL